MPAPRAQSVVCTGLAGGAGGAGITAFDETDEVHPSEFVTVKVYVPAARSEIVTLVPVPGVKIPPGLRVRVHVPVEGNLFSTTLPVGTVQVGLVIVPISGEEGMAPTVRVNVALAAAHGKPNGLSVVTVIVTFFPLSPFFGVYVNENGDFVDEAGLTEPAPSSVIVTFFALPPKVLPVTVTAVIPHMLPLVLVSVTVGLFVHCPDISIEINKKAATKRDTLAIFYLNNIDHNLQKYRDISIIYF